MVEITIPNNTGASISSWRLNREYGISVVDTFSMTIEPRREKANVLVSDLVLHKSGCTATEDG